MEVISNIGSVLWTVILAGLAVISICAAVVSVEFLFFILFNKEEKKS